MRLLTLSVGLAACSSSPISQYCASLAACSMDDCELSAEACEELRQGEQDACEADLKSTRDVIATGDAAACTTCVEAMDRYYTCAADIPTCTDFANAQTEDCDGEYQEYMEACTPQVQEACGQTSAQDTGDTRDTGQSTLTLPTDVTTETSWTNTGTNTGTNTTGTSTPPGDLECTTPYNTPPPGAGGGVCVTEVLACPSSVVEHTNMGGGQLFEADLQFLTCSGSASGDDFGGPERVYEITVPEEYSFLDVRLESCEQSWALWYQGYETCPNYQLETNPCGYLLDGTFFDQYDTLLVGGNRTVFIIVEGHQNDGGNFRLSVDCR